MRTLSQGRVLLLLYVDMIVTGDDTASIADTQRYFYRQFQMKGLGRLQYFLRFLIAQAERGILISQQKYTSDIIDDVALNRHKDNKYFTRASFKAPSYRWYTTCTSYKVSSISY